MHRYLRPTIACTASGAVLADMSAVKAWGSRWSNLWKRHNETATTYWPS